MSTGSSPQIVSAPSGTLWITVGLVLMIASAVCPIVPVVTAIALIALGTTEIVVSRDQKPASSLLVVLVHGATYTGLYALFIGARLYTPTAGPASSLTLLTMLDLSMSTLPMAIAARRVLTCLGEFIVPRP